MFYNVHSNLRNIWNLLKDPQNKKSKVQAVILHNVLIVYTEHPCTIVHFNCISIFFIKDIYLSLEIITYISKMLTSVYLPLLFNLS